MAVEFITPAKAARMVSSNQSIATSGFVCCTNPEALEKALGERYERENQPQDLTLIYAGGQGDGKDKAVNHFGHEGMLKRVISGHLGKAPRIVKLINDNKIEAYNLPLGTLSQLFRDIAGGRLGTITHVGLNTFVDPRFGGGKLNDMTKEDIVELVDIAGNERLLYKSRSIDIAFIRGTTADEKGNISFEKEILTTECLSIAQAARNSGGKVFVQVENVVKAGSLDPRNVKVPGICVDYVVVAENEEDKEQAYGQKYCPALCNQIKIPTNNEKSELDIRKIIARRAAMELSEDIVVNLGIGMPETISTVANEEGIGDYMTLTVEAGPIGGIPQGGSRFGASLNAECIVDQPYQFDFYDGGGLDLAFLGLAQVDKVGNINVSRFGPKIAGCGGFINITQNAKKVIFCGTFTAKGLRVEAKDGKLNILQEGQIKKFINEVEQITYSGEYAEKTSQPALFVTERAVFELKNRRLYLTEIAPGINLEKDVLELMDFAPVVSDELKLMDKRIFIDKPMGL